MTGTEHRWETSVLLAELTVRHTRRHMPTRRVALDHAYLPMTGAGHGGLLLSTVVAENIDALDEEQAELLPKLLDDARRGLSVPRIALRYRLQTDVHGLDRSRHRVLGEDGRVVVELDVHGAPVPQVLGAGARGRDDGPDRARGRDPRDHDRGHAAVPFPEGRAAPARVRHPAGGATAARHALEAGPAARGVPVGGGSFRRRWAMEVLGLRGGMTLDRDDISRRFRRLLRDAHPDHGGARAEAAERIAELTEARDLLIGFAASAVPGRRLASASNHAASEASERATTLSHPAPGAASARARP